MLAVALLLSGCVAGVGESRVAEYAEVGDELATQIVGFIPEPLDPLPALPFVEVRDGGPGVEAASDSVWWQYEQDIELAARAGASVEAAEEISRGLQADGWEVRRVRETEQGQRVADGFRRSLDDEGWYIEITYVRTPLPTAQRIELILVSPATVRGEPEPSDVDTAAPAAHAMRTNAQRPCS